MYESAAPKTFKDSDLTAIVTASALYNSEHGVTGVLLYANSKYVQILEGSKNELRRLMKKVKKDTRHGKIQILLNESLPVRNFASWSMGSVIGGEVSDVYRLSLTKIFEFAIDSYKRAKQ